MHLAIFSDCLDQQKCTGHPSMYFIEKALKGVNIWNDTPLSVMLSGSDFLTDYCRGWAKNILFCRVYSPRDKSSDDEESPRNVLRKKGLGSPRLSAWSLHMLDTCTHALVFIHSTSKGYTHQIITQLLKRTHKILFYTINVGKEDWEPTLKKEK